MPISQTGIKKTVNGKELTLYPISVLADRLSMTLESPRTTQTIRKWELNGVIPPAIFRVGNKRLYTMEQIDCICRVAEECDIRQGASLGLTQFSLKLFEELRKVNREILNEVN